MQRDTELVVCCRLQSEERVVKMSVNKTKARFYMIVYSEMLSISMVRNYTKNWWIKSK